MQITPVRTEKITSSQSINQIIDQYLPRIEEDSIIALSSKLISICEGSSVSSTGKTRNQMAEKEADWFIPANKNKYNYMITIKNNKLIASAGIDNGPDQFILWPKNPQESANKIRNYISKTRQVKNIGVIITDTKSVPLMRGTIGFCLAHSGFLALHDYRGQKDIFGGTMCSTVVNMAEAIATSAVLVMGEGNEQQPIATIEDIPFIQFQDRNPTDNELKELAITVQNDLFSPIINSNLWQKGKNK